jgi:hypothetical protein
MHIRLEIPGMTPPSLNRMGSRGNWRVWDRNKKLWQEHIGRALMTEVRPRRSLETPVIVDATLWFKLRRNRDEGNFRSLLEKATGDALVRGGYIPDDTSEHFLFNRLTFLRGEPLTVLVLRTGWSMRVSPNDGPERRPRTPGPNRTGSPLGEPSE